MYRGIERGQKSVRVSMGLVTNAWVELHHGADRCRPRKRGSAPRGELIRVNSRPSAVRLFFSSALFVPFCGYSGLTFAPLREFLILVHSRFFLRFLCLFAAILYRWLTLNSPELQ
jgi:hypothetical protein